MRIAITGGAGFIGSHLGKTLIDSGYEVVSIDSLIAGNWAGCNKNVERVTADLSKFWIWLIQNNCEWKS